MRRPPRLPTLEHAFGVDSVQQPLQLGLERPKTFGGGGGIGGDNSLIKEGGEQKVNDDPQIMSSSSSAAAAGDIVINNNHLQLPIGGGILAFTLACSRVLEELFCFFTPMGGMRPSTNDGTYMSGGYQMCTSDIEALLFNIQTVCTDESVELSIRNLRSFLAGRQQTAETVEHPFIATPIEGQETQVPLLFTRMMILKVKDDAAS